MQWNISLNCCLCTNLRVNPTDFFKETEKLEISELRALLRHKFNLTSSLAGSVDVLIPEQGHDDSNYSQDERKIRQHRLATALKWKQSYIQYHAITEKLELPFAAKIVSWWILFSFPKLRTRPWWSGNRGKQTRLRWCKSVWHIFWKIETGDTREWAVSCVSPSHVTSNYSRHHICPLIQGLERGNFHSWFSFS